MILALFFILVGVLFLLRNTGLLPDPAWHVVWPLVLIVLGGAMFLQKDAHQGVCWPGCPCVTERTNGRRKS